jgi:hypothetical protein
MHRDAAHNAIKLFRRMASFATKKMVVGGDRLAIRQPVGARSSNRSIVTGQKVRMILKKQDRTAKADDQPHSIANNVRIRGGVLNLSVATGDPRDWRTQHFALGGCPECGKANVYLNIGREAYCYCAEHKTCWPIGTIFSSWKTENEEIWRENAERLADYEVVAPYTGKGPVPMKFLRKLDHPDFAAEVAGFAAADGLFTNIVPDEPVSGVVEGGNVSPEMKNEDVRYFLERATNVEGDAVGDAESDE